MTYKEWASEYTRNAEVLKKQIEQLKRELIKAPISELKELNFRISTMYKMYLECMHTADILTKRKGELS